MEQRCTRHREITLRTKPPGEEPVSFLDFFNLLWLKNSGAKQRITRKYDFFCSFRLSDSHLFSNPGPYFQPTRRLHLK